MATIIQDVFLLQAPSITFSVTMIMGLLLVFSVRKFQKKSTQISSPPVVPGLPLIGNLHQLSEKKPHQTFTRWSEIYGPIYSIKTGASTLVVLNTTEMAKEAMVTRFSSISTRVLSNALTILTSDKCMVATSDYNEFYKTVKRNLHSGFLGANAQKRFRVHRDVMINNMVQKLHTYTKRNPFGAINVRSVIVKELFGLALKQSFGKDLESSIHVEELGGKLSKDEIFEILVGETTGAATDVDWRDFFPYLRWVPNKRMEMRMQRLNVRRKAVMKALTKEQKKRISSGEVLDSFVDFLSSKECEFTEDQVNMLIWEPIVETSDTTLATTEWAIYELANNKRCQGLLYHEIQSICGSNKITEEHLPQLKYLNAIIHETLRKHSPISILPPRYVHEDTQLGGYHIRAGTEIVINIYGCNMDKKQWKDPEKWRPERFLESKYDPTDLFKTMAFGGGKRLCLGAQQAMAISCMTIGTFVQEFQWSLEEGEKDDVSTLCLTTHKLHPLQAIITPREYIGCP